MGGAMVTVVGGPVAGANVLSLDLSVAAQRLGALYHLIPSTHTSTKLVFSLGVGDSWTMTGAGLGNFDGNGVPHSGTITGMSFTVDGVLESTFSNLKLSMSDLWGAVTAAHNGDQNAAPNLLAKEFAGNDTFTSNSADSSIGDTFLGMGGADAFNMQNSGPGSRVYGGDGNDTFNFGAKFLPATGDIVDGGAGTDTLNLDGGHTAVYYQPLIAPAGPQGVAAHGLALGADSLVSVEKINLAARSSYGLTLNDANVAHGATLALSGQTLKSTDSLYVNGAQLVSGGAVNVTGGSGADTLDGGAGSDTASYASAKAGVTVDLGLTGPQNTHGAGTDTLVSIENLIGSKFADTFYAAPGDNNFEGGAGIDTAIFSGAYGAYVVDRHDATTTTVSGPDGTDFFSNVEILKFTDEQVVNSDDGETLTARPGGDILVGNMSGDHLNGGAGDDVLTGGGGSDSFVFTALADSKLAAPDLITDWTSGDHIDLSAIDADTGHSGNHAFHLTGASGHPGDIAVHYDAAHGRTVIDLYVNADSKADAEIWLSGDHHDLSAGDFVL